MTLHRSLMQGSASLFSRNIETSSLMNQNPGGIEIAPNCHDVQRSFTKTTGPDIRADNVDADKRREPGLTDFVENVGKCRAHSLRQTTGANRYSVGRPRRRHLVGGLRFWFRIILFHGVTCLVGQPHHMPGAVLFECHAAVLRDDRF